MVSVSEVRRNVLAGPPIEAWLFPLPLRDGKLSSNKSGGHPSGLITVQMSEVQKIVPKSKPGSPRSCESLRAESSSEPIREKTSRFGEPAPIPPSISSVACERIVCETMTGVASGYFSRQRAATPATNGAAADVPLE